ncbi:uracil-DNA glycosylase [Sandarakinorhabdus rubra]|uniref:uracil-DNA glycosylase n=1 Tax=Sandarakinorhabdus rubra TaxID=2672568 RepID=UPI0013DAC3AB|nr:uracil-DNA glycosylase [Sandarakinorhabdus rubra]
MTDETPHPGTPPIDCAVCPRLVAYRDETRARHPGWWNAPVPPLGDASAWLAIIGLAPGLKGANRTGRPFHGDEAGALLFATLAELGLATEAPEGWNTPGLFITNAVACAPPNNLPATDEKHACRPWLTQQLAALPQLKVAVALGETAHQAAIKAIGGKLPKYRFGHGAVHRLPSGVTLIDSYHPSRLNLNTGTITPEMLKTALAQALAFRP